MKRSYLFDKLEIPEEHRSIEPQIRLWRAVLDRQMQDIVSEEVGPEAEQNRQEARIFMRGNTQDFWEVCWLACLEPSHVQYIARTVLGEETLYD